MKIGEDAVLVVVSFGLLDREDGEGRPATREEGGRGRGGRKGNKEAERKKGKIEKREMKEKRGTGSARTRSLNLRELLSLTPF